MPAIITWYDGFLPPVQCIFAPGTTLFGHVVCLHCFNFVNIPPPLNQHETEMSKYR